MNREKGKQMKQFLIAVLFLSLAATQAHTQINAGSQELEATLPFTVTQITTLKLPWRIAFLPDGRMLITEKVGGWPIQSRFWLEWDRSTAGKGFPPLVRLGIAAPEPSPGQSATRSDR
jgi:hypothetical protein